MQSTRPHEQEPSRTTWHKDTAERQGAGSRPPTTTTDTASDKTVNTQDEEAGGTVCRGRAGAPDKGAHRASERPQGEEAVPAQWVGGRVGVKPSIHDILRTPATADSKRRPAGGRGYSPAHQRRGPHVPQSNGICRWTCARADEPVPAEGSAVN